MISHSTKIIVGVDAGSQIYHKRPAPHGPISRIIPLPFRASLRHSDLITQQNFSRAPLPAAIARRGDQIPTARIEIETTDHPSPVAWHDQEWYRRVARTSNRLPCRFLRGGRERRGSVRRFEVVESEDVE